MQGNKESFKVLKKEWKHKTKVDMLLYKSRM